MTKRYREIEIPPIGRKFYPEELYIIKDISRVFTKDTFYFEVQNNESFDRIP